MRSIGEFGFDPRQSDQEIGDLLVLLVQPGAVTITGLADTKGAAGQRNADPVQRHRSPGHLPALSLTADASICLSAKGWPRHFFPRASFSSSACMLISAYIFFSRRFSSSKAFI